ncbi:exodeoxyribonuclease VII large subunit [Ruminococcus sp.]|uniref:exodeoxyribonuclease VII large subunit n=1 Tax=Ruminococcus sp. TaxID=41978 RepID=UPI0025F324F3|nr:exodeoxyribonuclease VII large subunit [Ruminococcus sp.]
MAILSVTQLNRYVGFKLKEDHALQGILVRGEISNFTNHYRSGHLYFTLRDEESGVKAVMFRGNAQRLRFVPQDGMRVIAAATASLYERDGVFQLYVTDLQPDGAGMQALALEQLKKKLTAMGVFDTAAKHPLPPMPRKIGVITSDTGAALQDVKNVVGRRYPIGHLLVYPAQVQGDAAADSVCRAIDAAQCDGCDVLIVGRGGGSAEDLQAFNTEKVVMAIYNCTVPIVSAVGHETDWTLADAAADLRAPTPSAAAELAVPDVRQMIQQVQELTRRMESAVEQQLLRKQQELGRLCDRLRMQSLEHRQEMAQKELESLYLRLVKSGASVLERCEQQLQQQATRLDMLSPLKILGRGYALAYHGDTLVRNAQQVSAGDVLRIQLAEGEIKAEVCNSCE